MFFFFTFFCDLQVFWNIYDFFFKPHFFLWISNRAKTMSFSSIDLIFCARLLVKADISYFTMIKFITQSHHNPSSYLGFKCAFFQKILFLRKNEKKAHLSSVLLGWQNGLHIRKERPIFDLGLSWCVFVTLETSCINNISKEPLGRWNESLICLWRSYLSIWKLKEKQLHMLKM